MDLHQCFQLSYLHPNRNSQAQLRSQMLIPMRRRGSPCRLTGCRASLARLTSTARPPGNLNLTPLERFTCADGWTGAENFALVFVSDAQFLSFYVCISDFGFDPLRLGEVPENLERFKESEVYHCRWAMLAVVSKSLKFLV